MSLVEKVLIKLEVTYTRFIKKCKLMALWNKTLVYLSERDHNTGKVKKLRLFRWIFLKLYFNTNLVLTALMKSVEPLSDDDFLFIRQLCACINLFFMYALFWPLIWSYIWQLSFFNHCSNATGVVLLVMVILVWLLLFVLAPGTLGRVPTHATYP